MQIARVICMGRITGCFGIMPDFVGTSSLAVERKTKSFQALNDLPVSEARQFSPLPANDQRIVERSAGFFNGFGDSLRSACASKRFFATSRAVSKVSVIVRPWATSPGIPFDVAEIRLPVIFRHGD